MEDEAIIALFWKRDQEAIRQTDLQYGRRLQRLSRSILNDEEDAKESVNDTYWKAWDTIPPQKPNYFFAYLAKICRYLSLGRLDWNRAQKRSAPIVGLTAELELCIPDRQEENRIQERSLKESLNRFLERLSQEKRCIFLRRYWFGDSIQEIARRYGIGESKVKTTLFRVRGQLRQHLQKEGFSV